MASDYEAHPGPNTVTGPIRIGWRLDTSKAATIDLTQNVILTGPRKSGITNLLRVLTARVLECNAVVWVYDSEGDLRTFAELGPPASRPLDWYGSMLAELKRMLDQADLVVSERRRTGVNAPSRSAPALVLVLNLRGLPSFPRGDEDDAYRAQIDRLAAIGPASGVFIVRAEGAPRGWLHTGYGVKIALRPDAYTMTYLYGSGPASDVLSNFIEAAPGSGAGACRGWAGDSVAPVRVDRFPRSPATVVDRPESLRFDAETQRVLDDDAGYSRRWERWELASEGKICNPGDMPTRDSDFLLALIGDAGTGGQHRIALVESLAARRGIEIPDMGAAQVLAQQPELVAEVDAWLEARVDQQRIVEHNIYPNFYVLAEHAEPGDAEPLLVIRVPHDRPMGLMELGQMLLTFGSTARVGAELTTRQVAVKQDVAGGIEFKIYAPPPAVGR